MNAIVLLDTSICLNVLDEPDRNQERERIFDVIKEPRIKQFFFHQCKSFENWFPFYVGKRNTQENHTTAPTHTPQMRSPTRPIK